MVFTIQCGQLPKIGKSFLSFRIIEHDEKMLKSDQNQFSSCPLLVSARLNAYNPMWFILKASIAKARHRRLTSRPSVFLFAIWIRLSISSFVIICLEASLISVARLCLALKLFLLFILPLICLAFIFSFCSWSEWDVLYRCLSPSFIVSFIVFSVVPL